MKWVQLCGSLNILWHCPSLGLGWELTFPSLVATAESSKFAGILRPFLYSSSVYSCHLLLISFASVRSILYLPFIMPIFAWNAHLVSPVFLKRSVIFSILLFSSVSLHCSLRKAYLSLLFFEILHSDGYIFLFLLCLLLLFFSQLFVRPPQTTILPFCDSFFWGWF